MADLGTIGIAIEVRGREALRQIESDMGIVDKTAKSAARSFEAFERAGLKTADTFRYMSDASKKRLAEEQKITQELIKQRSAAEQLARANAEKFQSQIGSNLGLGAQGISAGASATAYGAEIDKLSQKYDRIYAATKLYDAQVKELTRAEMLGVISKQRFNKELDQLDAELKQFTTSAEGAALANNRFSQHINQSGRGLNNFGMYAQQVGYQVGDFFVQVQSGTNVLVAFGQQATQLAGLIPGVLGAALGIGISLATAIGAAFMRSASDVESSSDRQVAAMKRLGEAIKETQGEIDKFRFGESATAFAENEIKNLETQISGINNLISAYRANIESAKTSANFEAALMAKDLAEEEIKALEKTRVELESKLETLKSLEEAQRMLNGHLSTAKGLIAAEADERARHKAILDQINATENERKNIFHALAGEMEAVSAAGIVFSRLDLKSGIASAASVAETLAYNLGISLDTASKLAALGPQGIGGNDPSGKTYGGRGAAPTQGQIVEQRLAGAIGYFTPPKPGKTKRGGSGAGKGQTQEEYIQELIREDEQKRKLIGISKEEQAASEREFKVREKLRDLKGSVTEAEIQATLRQMDATQKLIEQENRREAIISSASKTIEDAFMSMVDGSKSVSDAFKGMIRDILLNVYRQNVVSPIGDMLSGALKGVFQANGGAWNNGIQMFANGGVVGSPTMFRHSGGLGMMGEAGPEAIMPLKRGKNGKLGVQVDGNGGAVNIVQNFSFAANGDESVKRIIAQAAPQIAQMTQKQIIDSRRRGGSMKATFG